MARVFDTANFAPRDRRDAYMNAFVSSEVPMQVGLAPELTLSARMDTWDLGPGIHLLRTEDNGLRLTRTPRHLKVSAPERIALAYSGRHAGIAVGAESRRLRPGDLHVNDQTLPSDYAGYGLGGAQGFIIDYDVLDVPIDLGRKAVASVTASPLYELFRHHIVRACETLDALPEGSETRLMVGAATMDLARALLWSASGEHRLTRSVMNDTELTRVRIYVDQHITDRNLTPTSIARANHVSIRQLYKIWNSSGPSVSEYIVSARLNRARDDLQRPEHRSRSIFEIASACGFSDAAHFSRRFKSAFGMSPREWRQLP